MKNKSENWNTRARAKKWFDRTHKNHHKIVAYDGRRTFLTAPTRPGVVHIVCTRWGSFSFTDEPDRFRASWQFDVEPVAAS